MGMRVPLQEGGARMRASLTLVWANRGVATPRGPARTPKAAQVHCLALGPRNEWTSTLVTGPRQRQRNPIMYADGGASSGLKNARVEAERQLTPNPSTS